MKHFREHKNTDIVKAGLTTAFAALRKEGIIARQNFMCCGGCAGSALSGIAFERHQKGKTVNGVVFYHRQDTDSLKEYGHTYLGFGDVEHSFTEGTERKTITMGKPTIEVGQMIVKAIKDAGLEIDWNGTESKRIKVFATDQTVVVSTPKPEPTVKAVPADFKPPCKLLGENGNVQLGRDRFGDSQKGRVK